MIKKTQNTNFDDIEYKLNDDALQKLPPGTKSEDDNQRTITITIDGATTDYTLKIIKGGVEIDEAELQAAAPPPALKPALKPAPKPAPPLPPAAALKTYTFESFQIKNGDEIIELKDKDTHRIETKGDALEFTAKVNWTARGESSTPTFTTTPPELTVPKSTEELSDSYTYTVQKPKDGDSQNIKFVLTYNDGNNTQEYEINVIFTADAGGPSATECNINSPEKESQLLVYNVLTDNKTMRKYMLYKFYVDVNRNPSNDFDNFIKEFQRDGDFYLFPDKLKPIIMKESKVLLENLWLDIGVINEFGAKETIDFDKHFKIYDEISKNKEKWMKVICDIATPIPLCIDWNTYEKIMDLDKTMEKQVIDFWDEDFIEELENEGFPEIFR